MPSRDSDVLTSLATDVLSSLDCLAASDIGGSGSLLGIDCLGGVGLFNFEGLIGVVNDLSLNGDVFIADLLLGDLNILDPLLRNVLRDVLPEVLNGVVVSDSDLLGNGLNLPLFPVFDLLDLLGDSLDLGLVLVLDDLLLEGNVLDPALPLDDLLAGVHSSRNGHCGGSHNLGAAGWNCASSHDVFPA